MRDRLQRAADKISQAVAHLRQAPSGSRKYCRNCSMYRSKDNCTLVSGYVEGDQKNNMHITSVTLCDRWRERI